MTEGELILDFSEGIKKVMDHKNISIHKLAQRSGINKGLIHKYLNGEVYPNVRNMVRLLNGLNVSLCELLEGC